MKKVYLIVLPLSAFFIGTNVHAQSVRPMVINVAGGTKNFGYTTVDWSIGEMPLVNTMTGSTVVVVTNGLLQPFTEKPGNINSGDIFLPDEIRVFPNPASAYVEINFLTQQKGMMKYKLYNSMGQLIVEKQFYNNGVGRIERIDVQHLPATEYFLQVALESEAGSVAKKGGYKIIKL